MGTSANRKKGPTRGRKHLSTVIKGKSFGSAKRHRISGGEGSAERKRGTLQEGERSFPTDSKPSQIPAGK